MSLVVTEEHDMFVQLGRRRSGCADIAWSTRAGKPKPHAKVKAQLLTPRTASNSASDGKGEVQWAGVREVTRQKKEGVRVRGKKRPEALRVLRLLGCAVDGVHVPAEVRARALPFVAPLGLRGVEEVRAFLGLYGFWLGDGSMRYSRRRRRSGGYDAVHFPQQKESDITWLRQQLDALSLTPQSFVGVDGRVQLLIREPRWFRFFDSHYGSRHFLGVERPSSPISRRCRHVESAKCFLPWVLTHLTRDELRLLLEGYRRADGAWKQNRQRLYTASVSMRDELVVALLHAGYSPHFSLQRRAGGHH